ncbi:ABC-three component system middle component 1 [Sulfurovum sp. TSL1]|uniref:ABC-three component system middle component 1 n=1 Tax=Sulfurovum sp. TSL1 TaxID=2826994 RepID=UPI001CC57022|nr:ABC-three component system middle component 1 [Sulfurovum sp. TSL1]GIT97993.1 hypothetical protein TSL1_08140 [Sulfurovum sp. TSL1]
MSVTKIDNAQINELKTIYKLDDIQVVNIDNIISVLIKTNSHNLQNCWNDINSLLSEYLEEYLDNSFTRWNVYILFAITDNVSKELQYRIENNTFFARKIIEDNYSLQLSTENIKNLIAKHIEFTDLQIDDSSPNHDDYTSNSMVYSKLFDLDNLDDIKIDELLNSFEKDDNEI